MNREHREQSTKRLKFSDQYEKPDGKRVRVFYTSKPYVDHVYVARKDISAAERERLTPFLALKDGKE